MGRAVTVADKKNILFICTGNSARSILAEAIASYESDGRFQGFSAGSSPTGGPNPHALTLLKRRGIPTGFARSKSWDEFAGADAPKMDIIITVCDNAAGETCPFWPGMPATAHWGVPDPARVEGSDAEKAVAFAETYRILKARLSAFMSLPLESLDRMSLKAEMTKIGQMTGE